MGTPAQRIANEIADGKVGVERQMRANERKTARNLHRNFTIPGEQLAEQLGHSLRFPIGGSVIGQIGAARVGFREGFEIRRLPAIDGAGASKQEVLGTRLLDEFERALGALHDEFSRCAGVGQRPRRREGGVNHVREAARRKGEIPHVTAMHADCGVSGQVRLLGCEHVRGASEDDRLERQLKTIDGRDERLEQPGPEESRAARDEQPGAAQLVPNPRRMRENVIEISGRQARHECAYGKNREWYPGRNRASAR